MDHVCIHGHFYQPPRENPWDEAVPRQPGASPFHDWNARITAESYRPAGRAPIRASDGRLLAVVNTYARISFDIGPTLLRWLSSHAPDVLDAMIAGDRAAVARFGHGTAMAQAYSHVILPLASPRDQRTQIRWALADFEARFARPSEGLWLPECAVDTASLEALAAEGVRFTVVAPGQIEAVRAPGGAWQREVDPSRPYRVVLPSGRDIAVFAYEGSIAQAIAFGDLLDSGDALFERLRTEARRGGLAHTATDGESYGHHHRFGEMALAWALHRLARDPDVQVVPYGRYLADHPPTWEARIIEDSSWSCAHGIERWRSDCGCGTAPGGGHWRAPLRAALDGLAEHLDTLYERVVEEHVVDAWALRDAYVQVLLGADPHAWLQERVGDVDAATAERLRTALEAQRHRLLMYASCGWFFADLAGIEPLQDLACAWRAAELMTRLCPDEDPGTPFLRDLARARSNDLTEGTGADLLRRRVLPMRTDLRQVGVQACLGTSSAAHQVSSEAFGEGRSGWRVDRARVIERSTGHTAEMVRAWHPEAGLAGIGPASTQVDDLLQLLDADPEAWRRHLTWRTGRSEATVAPPTGPHPELLRGCAALDADEPRTAAALLDRVEREHCAGEDRALVQACLVGLLSDARTRGVRWRGIRERARVRLGVDAGDLRDARMAQEWAAWRQVVRERLARESRGQDGETWPT